MALRNCFSCNKVKTCSITDESKICEGGACTLHETVPEEVMQAREVAAQKFGILHTARSLRSREEE